MENADIDKSNIVVNNEFMIGESASVDQAVAPEPEGNSFRELRESLIKLNSAIPGLVVETTKDGKPEVLTFPKPEQRTIKDWWNDAHQIVAISNDNMRIITINAPHLTKAEPGGEGMMLLPASYPLPAYFKEGMTEEQITAAIVAHAGQMEERADQDLPIIEPSSIELGPTGEGAMVVTYPVNEQERTKLILDTKQRILLESLSRRNKENMKGQKSPFEKELKAAFDSKSLKPGENLAIRFSALADQLQAK